MAGSFIGVDVPGVQGWKGQLDGAHEEVIAALSKYQTIAEQNNQVAHGNHFVRINSECADITTKHKAEHDDLHAQYTKASNDLVEGVIQVTGG
jgi:hypothetical protein